MLRFNPKPDEIKKLMKDLKGDPLLPMMLAGQIGQPLVEKEVLDESMAGLFMEVTKLQSGEDSTIYVEPGYDAIVINSKGRPVAMPVEANEIDPPPYTIGALLIFRQRDLDMGKVRPLTKQKDVAESALKERLDQVCIAAAVAAVPDANQVASLGGKLTQTALGQAIVLIEDRKRKVASILARAQRTKIDMAGFDLSEEVKTELAKRGVVATWLGSNIAQTADIAVDKVLLAPDKMVGKCSIVHGPSVMPYYNVEPGFIGMYAEMTVKIGIGLPQLLSLVNIQA